MRLSERRAETMTAHGFLQDVLLSPFITHTKQVYEDYSQYANFWMMDSHGQIKPGFGFKGWCDGRARLVAPFANPLKRNTEKKGGDLCESPFERGVYDRLNAAGYRILTQVRAGGYRIDLVVEETADVGWPLSVMGINTTVPMLGWTIFSVRGLLSGRVGVFGGVKV